MSSISGTIGSLQPSPSQSMMNSMNSINSINSMNSNPNTFMTTTAASGSSSSGITSSSPSSNSNNNNNNNNPHQTHQTQSNSNFHLTSNYPIPVPPGIPGLPIGGNGYSANNFFPLPNTQLPTCQPVPAAYNMSIPPPLFHRSPNFVNNNHNNNHHHHHNAYEVPQESVSNNNDHHHHQHHDQPTNQIQQSRLLSSVPTINGNKRNNNNNTGTLTSLPSRYRTLWITVIFIVVMGVLAYCGYRGYRYYQARQMQQQIQSQEQSNLSNLSSEMPVRTNATARLRPKAPSDAEDLDPTIDSSHSVCQSARKLCHQKTEMFQRQQHQQAQILTTMKGKITKRFNEHGATMAEQSRKIRDLETNQGDLSQEMETLKMLVDDYGKTIERLLHHVQRQQQRQRQASISATTTATNANAAVSVAPVVNDVPTASSSPQRLGSQTHRLVMEDETNKGLKDSSRSSLSSGQQQQQQHDESSDAQEVVGKATLIAGPSSEPFHIVGIEE